MDEKILRRRPYEGDGRRRVVELEGRRRRTRKMEVGRMSEAS